MQQQTQATPASIKLSKPLRERVKTLAEARNQSAHAIMLQAIESYVDREEKREALRQEARAAHEHYVQTGLHLTNAEVVSWMDACIAGEKVPMPKCHI